MYRVCDGMHLVLASASPRRREMLARIGLDFTLAPARINEDILPAESAEQAAKRLACAKAQDAAVDHPQAAVLAADTLVALEETILGKPKDDEEAHAMLAGLSGKWHQVVTGYCLVLNGQAHEGLAASRVRFRRISPAEIAAYVRTGEPRDKAGAYGVQGLGAALVEAVEGSYTNVVGLPLAACVKLLLGSGIIEPLKEKTK